MFYLLFLLMIPFVAQADMYRCETKSGTIYSDRACPGHEKMETPSYQAPQTGLRPGELEMLREIKERNRRMKDAQARSSRGKLSYSDTMRIKQLEMRRRGLIEDNQNKSLSVGSGIVLREEIRSIDNEIERIRNSTY